MKKLTSNDDVVHSDASLVRSITTSAQREMLLIEKARPVAAAYNGLKKGQSTSVEPDLCFDAVDHANADYIASNEHQQDEQFWRAYVQPLKRHAYTHRNIDLLGVKSTNRCVQSVCVSKHPILQQIAIELNISEPILYIGVSAFLLRSLIGREYVSVSIPVHDTHSNEKLGMSTNILPLLVHIPESATFKDVLTHIAEETKSILVHQRYRIEEIRRLANYSSSKSFGPQINVMSCDHGEELEGWSSSSHFGANIDTNELQISFRTDRPNSRLEIIFDDIAEGHIQEQLASLKYRLISILDLIVYVPNSKISTLDALDERCRQIYTSEQRESFYANRRTPVAAGFLQWNRCADDLVRFVHANVWVGSGPSPFVTSKMLLANRVISINKLKRTSDSAGTKPPGTVLEIKETCWKVAVADGVVEISDFFDGNGRSQSAQILAKQCQILENDQLPVITAEQVKWLNDTRLQTMHSELYWSQRLVEFEPCTLSMCARNGFNQPPVWAASVFQILPFTEFSVTEVLAAWLIYIARDTQLSQIQIGWDATESNNRQRDNNELAKYIFAKTVPFSTVIDLNDTFSNVVKSVENEYQQMVSYLPCSSDLIDRHAICSSNDLNREDPWNLAVSLSDKQDEYSSTNSDAHGSLLTLQINKQKGAFRWIYNSNKLSEIEVNRISSHLLVLLESAHSRSQTQKPVGKLNLLPKCERELLLDTWNQNNKSYSTECFVHQLFEEQVTCNASSIAVECEGETMSYAELNAKANLLAHYLIERDVKPDTRVALCVKRSIKMVIAFFGILKAGGTYVPLDPHYPKKRLTNILQDANPLYLLVDCIGRKSLEDYQIPTVDLDSLPMEHSTDNPDPTKLGISTNNLAYIIYTSGTTGKPKGVMVEHQTVLNIAHTIPSLFDVTSKSRILQFASCCFDVSIWEMVMALTNGACLSLPDDEVRHADISLLNYLDTEKITHATLPPGLLRNTHNLSKLKCLKALILGAETPPLSLLQNAAMYTNVFNIYGPTEATIWSTIWSCSADFNETSIPIGRPLSNVRTYLLDVHGEPVPLGAEGELYIGGAGVSRGYLNLPELTADRFLPDPFCENPGARMYRSGDRACYLPDGNLLYLGRTDQQLKIRGFRIEPGEIEACLVKHPQVHDAVVLSKKNRPDSDAHLVAYMVTEQDSSLAKNLRTYLSSLLPHYMVPAAYVCLPSLPLTPNGKLDRRALPRPDDSAFARQSYEAPQGEMEEKLAAIWSDLLGIECISRHDNFFALGGHSLLIVRMLAQLRQSDCGTSIKEIFDTPNLAELAKTLGNHKAICIPPNLITANCKKITPEMLPLITLTQADIEKVVAQVPGGVSNIQDIYGLAPLQQGILFHHMMVERGDPYLLVTRLQLSDRAALERYVNALQKVIERHDILRTIFVWKDLSEPAQVVLRNVPSLLTEVKLDDHFNSCNFKLNLTQAPILHLVAAQTSEGDWMALQLVHHIIVDNVTLEILNAEVYAIFNGEAEHLETPRPYRDVVAQARLGVNQSDHRKFFSKMLGDIDSPTLPFGLSDVHYDGAEVDEAYLRLPGELNNHLREHARRLRISLASLCHLAWAQVLARTSGLDKVVFGTVLLGRLHSGEGNDNIVGLMINTLPLRLDIDETTVENAVRNAHYQLSDLLEHEHASLALAQRCSGVSTVVPLFNTLLNCRHRSQANKLAESYAGVNILGSEGRTNYPLTLSVDDDDKSLSLTTQVVHSLSAARICSYMQQALLSLSDALTHSPNQAIRTLRVMPQEERTMLLHSWNETSVNYPLVSCLHQLFESQVDQNGQAIAVECEGETLSYAELNAQANQLAHYLIAKGVKPDDRIAICVKRNIKLIVAILGVLKSGGAYVPLDPVYSSQRLINILEDAAPLYLLADSTGQKALGTHKVPVVNLDDTLTDNLSIENLDPSKLRLTSNNLAYIIYTSGSTGTPKGVMIEHKAVVNLAQTQPSLFGVTSDSRVLQFASYSFDASVWEILMALTTGARLCLPIEKNRKNFTTLLEYLNAEKITHATLPAALLQNVQDLTHLKSVHTLILAGETPNLLLLKSADPSMRIFNAYGPTEATICATNWLWSVNFDSHLIPIGRPISNTRVYLLDSHCEPVPLGAEGELYIGGAGVARGYLNRPELTAERFLPDPFSNGPEARMYRTGDMARYLPDGNLVFLGRNDQQVKIRGFRIELGEIEARLIEYPSIHRAIVLPWKKTSDTKDRLVAYVVADADPSLANNLRTYLISLLPDYMVPAAYVRLSSLPLTPNGKVDKRALPPPDDESYARQSYVAPQGEMEKKLASIWSELLGIEQIGRHDNFFSLGGHSLLIVRMLTQLRQAGLNTSVKEIFDTPTLTELAKTIGNFNTIIIPHNLITENCKKITPEMLPLITLSQDEIEKVVAQVPGGVSNIQDIYGLAPLQQGILFHHMMVERGDPYLLVTRLQLSDRGALERYASALQKVVERHDIVRTAFIWDGLSEPAQVVLRHVPSLLTEVILDESDEPLLDQLTNRFHPRDFKLSLTQAPLLRLLAAQTSEGDWMVLQLMHHIIGDHDTLERLNEEIQAIASGQAEQLEAPKPFRDIVAQARLGVSQSEHTKFFTDMLADVESPTLAFAITDVHRDGTEVDESYQKLPAELNNQLRDHARRLLVSLASLFHLAWAQVLSHVSGNETVVFGTVLFGRSQSGEGIDRVMGLLINTLPLRLDIDETAVESAVRKAHSRLSALLSHEYASLALAQRCSGVSATLPLFNALLNYRHNQPTDYNTSSIPGVIYLDDYERTNYPLTLSVDDDSKSLSLTAVVVHPLSASRICSYMKQALVSLSDALAHTPQKLVRELPVVPQEEREMVLHSWNQTTVDYTPSCCIHELFEAQVERDGKAIAVECDGKALTYDELNTQANQLAHYLIEKEVKPDNLIAVCLKRSIKMIVAILGVLKSGAAYVPLDPAYSSQRLTNILKDANPLILLADATGLEALGDHKFPILDLDKPLPNDFSSTDPDSVKLGLRPDNLAYIIYTSGSTGKPKGVMIEHQATVNMAHTISPLLEITSSSRVLQFASCSFDASLWEIVWAITTGACLNIPNEEVRQTDTTLLRYIRDENITHVILPPALFQNIQNLSNLSGLRALVFGGETPALSLLQNASAYTKVFNAYGPTEVTICASIWQFTGNSLSQSVSIGRPIANTKLYVLDAHGEPVPLGAEGELYISGTGVARGYLNRPDLTAERFFLDPFTVNRRARMYRTGDLARYLPDGNLVYLGRADQQVKIRGFRIEPGEIEARLVEHPSVSQAVVLPWKTVTDTNDKLVAYVEAEPDSSLAKNLRTYLSSILPEYMVPATYVCLPSLPLTPNGKLDKRALQNQSPDDESFARQSYETPQGEMEEKLAAIWSDLLGIERISRHDNFFELGGHSLLVIRFVNLAQKIYNIEIDARGLFSFPILKSLAEKLTISSDRLYCASAIPIRRHGDQAPIFLLPDGYGDTSYAFELAHEIDKNHPVYVLPWSSREKEQPASIEEMATTMIPLIRNIQPNGPCALAGYSAGGILAYEIANQLIKSGYSVSFLGLIDTYPPNGLGVSNETDLKNEIIGWEELLLNQCVHYKKICTMYEINPLPITVNLFKAIEFDRKFISDDELMQKGANDVMCSFKLPKLGWENCQLSNINVISVNGGHFSMMTDSSNRNLLGKKITELLRSK